MIKKGFIGVVIAAAFGLLVLGAVNRTLAKSVENEPLALSEGSGGGNGGGNNSGSNGSGSQNQALPGSPEDCDEEGEAYGGPGNDRSSNNNDGTNKPALDGTGYQGGGNQGAGSGQGGPGSGGLGEDGLGEGEAEVETWGTLEGVLSSAADDLWIITLNDGTTFEIEGCALSFAIELGFQASAGDQLRLTGFYENEDFKVGVIENLTTGEIVTLREESGRPLWAGGGRGGNQ
jgi:hypothetical protein